MLFDTRGPCYGEQPRVSERTQELRFTADEVEEIFRVASRQTRTELQADGGLGLSELTEIAREVGIDPRAVVRAAEAIRPTSGARTLSRLRSPRRIRLVKVVPGEASPEAFEAIAADLHELFREGTPTRVGPVLTYRRDSDVWISVRAQDGNTRIIVEREVDPGTAALWAPVVIVPPLLSLGLAFGVISLGAAASAGASVAVIWAAQAWRRHVWKREHAWAARLLARIERAVHRG